MEKSERKLKEVMRDCTEKQMEQFTELLNSTDDNLDFTLAMLKNTCFVDDIEEEIEESKNRYLERFPNDKESENCSYLADENYTSIIDDFLYNLGDYDDVEKYVLYMVGSGLGNLYIDKEGHGMFDIVQ